MSLQECRNQFSHLLAPLSLSREAEQWLLDMWEAFQGLDDWRDGDQNENKDIERVIYLTLVQMPSNPFFQAHANRLLPVLSNVVLKWTAANVMEDAKHEEQLPKAYMWRAGFYDLILEVVNVSHGFNFAQSAAPYILALYGETYEEYKKEFING